MDSNGVTQIMFTRFNEVFIAWHRPSLVTSDSAPLLEVIKEGGLVGGHIYGCEGVEFIPLIEDIFIIFQLTEFIQLVDGVFEQGCSGNAFIVPAPSRTSKRSQAKHRSYRPSTTEPMYR